MFGREAPEERLALVGALDIVFLVDFERGGDFGRRVVVVRPVKLTLTEVLIL